MATQDTVEPLPVTVTDPVTGVRTVTSYDGKIVIIDEPADPVIAYDSTAALAFLQIIALAQGHPKLKGILDRATDELEQMTVTATVELAVIKKERAARVAARFAKIKEENDAIAAKKAAEDEAAQKITDDNAKKAAADAAKKAPVAPEVAPGVPQDPVPVEPTATVPPIARRPLGANVTEPTHAS